MQMFYVEVMWQQFYLRLSSCFKSLYPFRIITPNHSLCPRPSEQLALDLPSHCSEHSGTRLWLKKIKHVRQRTWGLDNKRQHLPVPEPHKPNPFIYKCCCRTFTCCVFSPSPPRAAAAHRSSTSDSGRVSFCAALVRSAWPSPHLLILARLFLSESEWGSWTSLSDGYYAEKTEYFYTEYVSIFYLPSLTV